MYHNLTGPTVQQRRKKERNRFFLHFFQVSRPCHTNDKNASVLCLTLSVVCFVDWVYCKVNKGGDGASAVELESLSQCGLISVSSCGLRWSVYLLCGRETMTVRGCWCLSGSARVSIWCCICVCFIVSKQKKTRRWRLVFFVCLIVLLLSLLLQCKGANWVCDLRWPGVGEGRWPKIGQNPSTESKWGADTPNSNLSKEPRVCVRRRAARGFTALLGLWAQNKFSWFKVLRPRDLYEARQNPTTVFFFLPFSVLALVCQTPPPPFLLPPVSIFWTSSTWQWRIVSSKPLHDGCHLKYTLWNHLTTAFALFFSILHISYFGLVRFGCLWFSVNSSLVSTIFFSSETVSLCLKTI